MQLPLHLSPRCGAKTRRRAPCQSPATPNGRCRMHGGKSPKGSRNAFKHGFYSAESIATRREARSILQAARKVIEDATKGG
jgi:hypothetical protein